MKYLQIIKLFFLGVGITGLISCGSIEQLKVPSKVEYRVTGDLGRGEVVKIKTREDVTIKAKYKFSQSPKAHVILFPGHGGRLMIRNMGKPHTKIGSGDFLSRNFKGFSKYGLNVVLVDCPSDNCRENKGMLWGFRASEEHVVDIAHIIAYLKEKDSSLPIWLIGVGRGTESAINVTMRLKKHISGLVLASSTTSSTEFGDAVDDYDLELVTIPVLAISHEDDECPYSDPDDQEDILDDMENAKTKKLVIIEGGDISAAFKRQRCNNKSNHMFYQTEDDAMEAIIGFIKEEL